MRWRSAWDSSQDIILFDFAQHSGYYYLKISQKEETYYRGRSSAPVGGPSITGGCFMTKIELQDNLVFLSALKLLEQLTEKGLLTVDEAEKSRIELERKLRPTLLFA